MAHIISIHSFRCGTGKSQIAVAVGATLATKGYRVCLVDLDVLTPGLHILLGVDTSDTWFMNDYLDGECDIADTVIEIDTDFSQTGHGKLFLVPSNPSPSVGLHTRWEPEATTRLHEGYQRLSRLFNFDLIVVDTHAGLSEQSMSALAVTDTAAIIMRPDRQDYQGTALLVDLARSLWEDRPIDLGMGWFNTIWQGDANAIALQTLARAQSPPLLLNLTGPAILNVRQVCTTLARLLDRSPRFTGEEGATALLSNATQAFRLFGPPRIPEPTLIQWVADWIREGGPTLGKPTHFEVRTGRF